MRASSLPHLATDVTALGADFLAFSGHKMLGPTGIGVLWGPTRSCSTQMPPFLGGGGMILRRAPSDGFVPADLPHKFEAGTPPIAEIVGLGAAIDYLGCTRDGRRCAVMRSSSTAYALSHPQRSASATSITHPRSRPSRPSVVPRS